MRRTLVLAIALASLSGVPCPASADPGDRPNVVLIMTDNHGPWTLGCYGNPEIRTPNIDRLAAEGTLFTRAFANNAVCSPTRATYLTGLMPSQHGVHRYLGAGGVQVGPNARSTIAEYRTLPEILHEAGYVCGLSGKWHLGANAEPQEGFSAWVTKPHGHSLGFYDQEVIEGGETRVEPTYLTEFWTDRGIEFIRSNRDRPFFLFLAYNGPYGLGGAMREEIRNRHRRTYADAPMDSFPRGPMHPWLHSTRDLFGRVEVMRKYSAEVSGVDDGVGRVVSELEALGLDDRTVVVFCADQGLAGGHSGFWGMGDHTRPLTAYDWTMHIPTIWRHPGRIAEGNRVDRLISNYDLMPTLLSHLGLSGRMPDDPPRPGRDYSAALRGEEMADWEDEVFYEFEDVRAIRTTRWKYIERFREGPDELFDLGDDPGERTNLIDRPELADVRRRLGRRLEAFFDRYAEPEYDLWRGGRSKSGLMNPEVFGIEGNPEREPAPGR